MVLLLNNFNDFEIGGGDIRGTKGLKGHQVQNFRKSIFEVLCTEKAFWASWEVKIMSRSPKVIKCKFSKRLLLSYYAQKKWRPSDYNNSHS